MNEHRHAVEAAGKLRTAREALGHLVGKEVEAIYGLFINNAAIGNSVNSYFEVEGKVHVLDVDIDFDIEKDYIILNMSPKYKELPINNYTITFNKVSEGATLVDEMLVAFRAWQAAFESYRVHMTSK